MAKNPRLIDLTDTRHGRWTVLRQAGNTPRGGALWLCRCDCGNEAVTLGADLRKGKTQSCGCLAADVTRQRSRTHGATGTRLYNIWKLMHARCADAQNKSYGGCGIAVCADWQSFEPFRDWALSNGYTDNLSIERRDNDKGYAPSNCTWATALTQSNNRRFVRKMPDGRPAPLVAQENGIPARTFNVRVFAGWSIEEAATAPYRKRRKPHVRGTGGRFA